MKKLPILFLFIFSNAVFAQNSAGTIKYIYERSYLKMIEKSKYMEDDAKQRAIQTWKNDRNEQEEMELIFNEKGSYYSKPADARGDAWQKDSYWVRRDFIDNTILETQILGSKTYIVEDSLYHYTWKINSEIKEIAGYVCLLANTHDTIRNIDIEAWFAMDIPASVGPEEFMGLPGAILELNINDGVVTLKATSVKLDENQELPPLPKKLKKKRINHQDYLEILSKYFKTLEERRNLPWGVRY